MARPQVHPYARTNAVRGGRGSKGLPLLLCVVHAHMMLCNCGGSGRSGLYGLWRVWEEWTVWTVEGLGGVDYKDGQNSHYVVGASLSESHISERMIAHKCECMQYSGEFPGWI